METILSLTLQVRQAALVGGSTLSATLDRIRITTTRGVNTFDAGAINIM